MSGETRNVPLKTRMYFLVIGTSALVYPAAGLANTAKRAGAKVIEINIAQTPLSHQIDEFLEGSSADLLPQLMA